MLTDEEKAQIEAIRATPEFHEFQRNLLIAQNEWLAGRPSSLVDMAQREMAKPRPTVDNPDQL